MINIVWLCSYHVLSLLPELAEGRCNELVHASSWIRNLAVALACRNDIKLHIVTESPLISQSVVVKEQDGIVFHILKSGVPFMRRSYPSVFPLDIMTCYFGNVRRLVDEVKRIKPDLVHSHGTEAAYSLAGVKSGFLCLVSVQGIVSEIFKVSPSPHAWIVSKLERIQVAKAKYFACRTDFDHDFVRSINSTARIFKIGEVVGQSYFNTDWRVENANRLLYVGTLCHRKGLETLLDTVAILKEDFNDVRLSIVGDGKPSYLKFLKEKVAGLCISDAVEFMGFLPAESIAALHAQAQVFVFPTEVDNSPNAIAEAMVTGLPIIASRVGGIPSMVRHKGTAYLVNHRDPAAFAEGIKYLLRNPDVRSEMGRKARQEGREHFCAARIVKQTMDAYSEILQTRPGTAG